MYEMKRFVSQDYAGNVQEGTEFFLYMVGTSTAPPLFLDKNDVQLTNPFLAGSDGTVEFQAPDEVYDLRVRTPLTDKRYRIQCLSVKTVLDMKIQLDALTYVPPDIVTFLVDGMSSKIVERGSTVASATLSWVLNDTPLTSQAINQGVGTVPVGTTSRVAAGPITTDRTWTLTVTGLDSAGQARTDSMSTSLIFRQKRYWGVSAGLTLSNADILSMSNEFATARGKTVTYNASGGRYPFYCYPKSFGALTNVAVGGFAYSDYTLSEQSFTNASGFTEDYYVFRFNGIQTGSNIVVAFT